MTNPYVESTNTFQFTMPNIATTYFILQNSNSTTSSMMMLKLNSANSLSTYDISNDYYGNCKHNTPAGGTITMKINNVDKFFISGNDVTVYNAVLK